MMTHYNGNVAESHRSIDRLPSRVSSRSRQTLTLDHMVLVGLFLLYVLVIYRTAWLGDDAYITFRTVDNFVHGYGLTWNVSERVQAYTHPLWMFLMSVFYFFTREIYYTSLAVSAAISTITMYLVIRTARTLQGATIAVALLTVSKAYTDYSTSGLENPLTHLLLVIFVSMYWKRDSSSANFRTLCFVASLIVLNRMDTLLLVAPSLMLVFFQLRTTWLRRIVAGVVGFLPFVIWEVFSIVYYGFPFPNTAYAKLNTGIGGMALARQGLNYYMNSLRWDFVTLLTILFALALAWRMTEGRLLTIAAGVTLYSLYVIRIGGDFMSGRFFTASLICCVLLISESLSPKSGVALGCLASLLFVGSLTPFSPITSGIDYAMSLKPLVDSSGICDERRWYWPSSGLLLVRPDAEKYTPQKVDHWSLTTVRRDQESGGKANEVGLTGIIGHTGFRAGPATHIVDDLALSDPLLARLPALWNPNFRIGHFKRLIPEGYLDSLRTDSNKIANMALRQYYDRLSLVTRGPLFSGERFLEICRFNVGYYKHLVDQSFYRRDPYDHNSRFAVDRLFGHKEDGSYWNAPGNIVIPRRGVIVMLGRVHYSELLAISLDHNDDYKVSYLRSGAKVADGLINAVESSHGGLVNQVIDVPKKAQIEGYDSIEIVPRSGDGRFSLGHVYEPYPLQNLGFTVSTINTDGNVVLLGPSAGALVVFGSTQHGHTIELGVTGVKSGFMFYLSNGLVMYRQAVPVPEDDWHKDTTRYIPVPIGMVSRGYDSICFVVADSSNSSPSLRHIKSLSRDGFDSRQTSVDFPDRIIPIGEIAERKPEGTTWDRPGNYVMSERGLRISIGDVAFSRRMEISLDSNDKYRIKFFRSTKFIDGIVVGPTTLTSGLALYVVQIPETALIDGFDTVTIIPAIGDRLYSLGHMVLSQ